MIIYKTTNLVNNKIYIGQDSKNNIQYLGSGQLLNLAIKKYGVANFKKEVLEVCENKKHLDSREIYWISFYNSTNNEIGYNIANGGSGGDTYTHNPNRELIREKMKGRPTYVWTEADKDRQRGANNPAKRPEVRQKISEAKKGKPRLDQLGDNNSAKRPEVRMKISNSLKGKLKNKIQCPFCNKEGQPSNMYRWHFTNCKTKH